MAAINQSNLRLWQAVEAQDAREIQASLDAGAEVDCEREDGSTPLQLAAKIGDLTAVRILVDNKPTQLLDFAFFEAAVAGHTLILSELLNRGVKITSKDDMSFSANNIKMESQGSLELKSGASFKAETSGVMDLIGSIVKIN